MATTTTPRSTTAARTTTTQIEIAPIQTRTIEYRIIGIRPIIMSRLVEKARRELLLPTGRKTVADRAASMKHDPVAEYRAAPYIDRNEDAPTLLAFPASAFKQGMMTAALRTPNVKKTEVAQLLWVEGDLVSVWGVPNMIMSITRSADMNRTPDVRTRCILPEWVTGIRVTYVYPNLNESSVTNLLVTAGQLSGVGDWRPQKGAGTYGQYAVVSGDDFTEFDRIVAAGGRAAQQAGLDNPVMYDTDTAELLEWYLEEVHRRGKSASITGITPQSVSAD